MLSTEIPQYRTKVLMRYSGETDGYDTAQIASLFDATIGEEQVNDLTE